MTTIKDRVAFVLIFFFVATITGAAMELWPLHIRNGFATAYAGALLVHLWHRSENV